MQVWFDLIWFVLDRIGHQLDDHQPEERHGFRRGKRNEKQFLHANAFLDKALDVGIPVWVVILCFWPCPLASTLDKLVWTRHLRTLGLDDFEIKLWAIWRGRPIDRSKHKIQHYRRRAARICFEPSSLLCRVTICHAYWRLKVGDFFFGFDLSDGILHLIDVRFANDILLFGRSAMEVRKLLDNLVAELSEVGLLLNATKLLSYQAKGNRSQQSRLIME